MRAPSVEWLIRLLVWIVGTLTTVVGSWVASKIRVYDDNRKAHLEDIKQRVLIPLNNGLTDKHTSLVTHRSPVVRADWGLRLRRKHVGITEQPDEHGPILALQAPDIQSDADQSLYADAKKNHFSNLIAHIEEFLAAWRAHAGQCHAWILSLSEEILAKSKLPEHTALQNARYVMQYRLAIFVYFRLFHISGAAAFKQNQSSGTQIPSWVLEIGSGRAAAGTEEEMDRVISLLEHLFERERDTAVPKGGWHFGATAFFAPRQP